jgi:hypothetical protein
MKPIDRPPLLSDLDDGSSPDSHRRRAAEHGARLAREKARRPEPILIRAEAEDATISPETVKR